MAPIQLAIRLLIPRGSRLLDLPEIADFVQPFDPATLTHPWHHPDGRVDALQNEIMRMVGRQLNGARAPIFEAIRRLAYEHAGRKVLPVPAAAGPSSVPFVSEPWSCCAEPSPEQLRMI